MSTKIERPIVSWSVRTEDGEVSESGSVEAHSDNAKPEVEPEALTARPHELMGKTYKISTPAYDHAIYVTINDIQTPYGVRPYELFLMSRVMESYQWITLCTRLVSAIFRQQAAMPTYNAFVVEEFLAIFDPGKQYWSPHYKGQYMHSVVQEIGFILREHLETLDLVPIRRRVQKGAGGVVVQEVQPTLPPTTPGKFLTPEEEIAPTDIAAGRAVVEDAEQGLLFGDQCPDCHSSSMIMLDGCPTCVECGYSKCS